MQTQTSKTETKFPEKKKKKEVKETPIIVLIS